MVFESAWKRRYFDCPPLSYVMREAEVPNWVRFHSLPESKRYPDDQADHEILLTRQNALAAEVLGPDQACWMVQACWHTPEGVIDLDDKNDPFWPSRKHCLTFSFQFRDDDMLWSANAAQVSWSEGAFDKVLLAIANEKISRVLWMSASSGAVFAPYDGGVDLFLPDGSMVHALKVKHATWLPPNPEGL